jgi:hypothetical protein
LTAAYFEDHPTDPDKVILRKPKHESTWVNLTNEEIGEIYRVGWANNMELARAIEAKLKEKNVGTL